MGDEVNKCKFKGTDIIFRYRISIDDPFVDIIGQIDASVELQWSGGIVIRIEALKGYAEDSGYQKQLFDILPSEKSVLISAWKQDVINDQSPELLCESKLEILSITSNYANESPIKLNYVFMSEDEITKEEFRKWAKV